MTEVRLAPVAMAAGGAALARLEDGRVAFVGGALPGEVVSARITEQRRDFARAALVEVLEPSPDRVAPPCPALAAGCGGCTWQHVAPEAQPRLKADIVADALRRIAKVADPPAPRWWPLDGPALRTTARLAVAPDGRAGHRPRGQRGEAVATASCLAAHPLLEDLIVNGRFPGATEVVLRVAAATAERLVRADRAVEAVGVPGDVVVVATGGSGAAVHEVVGGRRFRVSAESFFQPGPVAAGALAAAVLDAVGTALPPSGGHVVDAYAGVGLLGAVIAARHGARVTAVENHAPAVADARVNLAGLDAGVIAADVGRWRAPRSPADVVVADPSRTGLSRPGVTALVAARARRFVLASCDPASFARDARLLAASGYRLTAVTLVDAFPHTFHVETVGRFDFDPPEASRPSPSPGCERDHPRPP